MTAPRFQLIGLAGVAGAGKDAAGEHLFRRHGFWRYAFAMPIRDALKGLLAHTGIDVGAWMAQRDLKERAMPGLDTSYRRLAQTMGTEWGRDTVHPDLWIRIAAMRLGLPGQPRYPRIVITDVRMPNEALWIREMGGQVWRLDRPQAAPVAEHRSESYVQALPCDAAIDNSSGFSALYEALDFQVGTL